MMNAPTVVRSLLRCVARRLSGVGAFLLAGVVLFAALAATSPDLHKLLHHSASDPGHFCFVTLFGHHLIAGADGDVTTARIVQEISFPLRELRVFFPHFAHEFPPGRAPPTFFVPPVG